MTSREINQMPLRRQFAMVAHLYRLELTDLCRLCGRWFIETATAAGQLVYELGNYHKHRHAQHRR